MAVGRVAVIGETSRVAGFMLAGGLVLPAEDAAAAREAWTSLPPDVAVVVLTPAAAAAIESAEAALPDMPLTVVMPL